MGLLPWRQEIMYCDKGVHAFTVGGPIPARPFGDGPSRNHPRPRGGWHDASMALDTANSSSPAKQPRSVSSSAMPRNRRTAAALGTGWSKNRSALSQQGKDLLAFARRVAVF